MKKLNQEDLKRKKAIEDFLEKRTSINIEKSLEELIEASSIIKQLNDFIDSKLELSSKEIESKIKRLISHFTITLIYEFNSEIALRRRPLNIPCQSNSDRRNPITPELKF